MDSRVSARSLATALGGWRTRQPAYEALADGIRLLCLDNRLAPKTTLPAERELAGALRVSRSTVSSAYASLRTSGHVSSLRGSGTVTLALRRHEAAGIVTGAGAIDLQQASPPAWPGLAGIVAETAQDAAAIVARSGYDTLGSRRLRQAIAARYVERGIPTDADEVLVTTGAQSAIHLVASALLARGDRVLIETPTYPHAAEALRRAGGRLVGVPVTTGDGWDLDRAQQAFARTLPALAYLMPGFQNPTGRTMTPLEHETLAAAAERAGTVLVLDETTVDLDIDGTSAPPARVRSESSVVRIGSLGKTVWGGLRIGWVRAREDVIRRLAAERPAHDLGTPELEQEIAVRVLDRFDDVLAQRARLLGAGRDALVAALGERLPSWRVPTVDGGLSLWVELGAALSPAVVMDARTRGVLLSAGPRFAVDGGHERHLRLPFTAPVTDLVRAVDILADSWRRVRAGVPHAALEALDPVI